MARSSVKIIVLIAVCWIPDDSSAQQAEPFEFQQRHAELIRSAFSDFRAPSNPGYAIGIIQRGELAFAEGFGGANLDYGIDITPQSVFNVASLSKQFTAAALALLILDGEVSLTEPVSNYVRGFPEAWESVRVEHLVYMTSGIPEYYRQKRPGGLNWGPDYFTVDDAIEASLSAPALEFEPGTEWAYSNINYMLIARIVANVSQQSFAAFLADRIFSPLGMTDTHVNDDVTRVVPNRAIGYNLRDGGGYSHHNRVSPHYGGSGVFTTVEDLTKWDSVFYTHALAGPRFTDLMLSTRSFQHDKANDAFGLVWGKYQGHDTLWYEGGDLGFSAYMVRIPSRELTVVVLSNLGTGRAADKARSVLDILWSN